MFCFVCLFVLFLFCFYCVLNPQQGGYVRITSLIIIIVMEASSTETCVEMPDEQSEGLNPGPDTRVLEQDALL